MPLMPLRLSDGVVELRRCSLGDRDASIAAMEESWSQLHDWLLWAQHEMDVAHFDDLIKDYDEAWANDTDWRYFTFDAADESFLGAANIYTMSDPEMVGIGYWVRSSRTGRGYATRASRILTSAAFDYLPLVQTVEIQMDVGNVASVAVARRLGFRLVSEIPKERLVPASSGRALLWRIDRDEWRDHTTARSN